MLLATHHVPLGCAEKWQERWNVAACASGSRISTMRKVAWVVWKQPSKQKLMQGSLRSLIVGSVLLPRLVVRILETFFHARS